MSWTIEGLPGKRFACFAKVNHAAKLRARKQRKAVKVRFHGRKNSNNTALQRSDFMVHPNGRVDPTVDGTWYKKRPKKGT